MAPTWAVPDLFENWQFRFSGAGSSSESLALSSSEPVGFLSEKLVTESESYELLWCKDVLMLVCKCTFGFGLAEWFTISPRQETTEPKYFDGCNKDKS